MVHDHAGVTRSKSKVILREITDADLEAVADLQVRGFKTRPRDYWLRGLHREQTRDIPKGFPRYGYVLEAEGRFVGGVLVMYAEATVNGERVMCCNAAGWNVEPEFRGHAPRLLWAALNRKDVIYTDVTPAVSTYDVVERLGFRRYCNGLFVSLPFLARKKPQMRIEIVSPTADTVRGLPQTESDLLVSHARYGCLSLVCHTLDGPQPFIFLPFRMRQGKIPLPAMQLAFCRDIDSYRRCAGAIGRELIWHGKPVVFLDANGMVEGLPGFYTEKRGRKYFKGPRPPALTNLTNTELALFGL